ncbi:uncharacterized protein C8A04DRAFT_10638 [Dichotomopilus funicola]|uniref:Uncharacterized protein n=1 Tax=Dichotomopilus funicola TaxID=1934379 RepID=A0AAN6V611_9PEZI|nr:hypothetical protein C8A04DRAFT_10638 [Dichotomopilus funicola]
MAPLSKPRAKGPLQAPQKPPTAVSYTQPRSMQSETEVRSPESNRVVYREVSLTATPHPFVNPSDAFSQPNLKEPDPKRQ